MDMAFCAALMTIALISVSIIGCDQPFDPRAPLDQQLVVYSVLSTDRDIQFVRVNSDYMPAGFDPNVYNADNAVRDASVTISSSGSTAILRDTVLARPDTSRYNSPMYVYAVKPFTPQRGRAYEVWVHSPSLGTAFASTVIPTKPLIVLADASVPVLMEPFKYAETSVVQYTVDLSGYARGYTSHLYIYYDVLKGSRWVEERAEVPVSSSIWDTTYSLQWAQYAELTVCPESNRLTLQFANGYLKTIIYQIRWSQYVDTHLIFKWVVLVLLQADQNLFGYYQSIRGYRDPQSIRLDEPQYSKINGGIGVVGAYALDSLVFVLPERFVANQ
jgi:hypothetical protein